MTCTQAVALPQLSYRLGVIQWAIFLFHAALYGSACLLVLKKHAALGNMLLFSHTSSEHLSQRHKGATIVFYNAPSSRALILLFFYSNFLFYSGREGKEKTEREREKNSLPASERVMFLSHTNSSLSRCAIYLSHSHEGCCSPSLSSGHRAQFTGRTGLYRCCLGDAPLGNGAGFLKT